jgi:hypothetical protein
VKTQLQLISIIINNLCSHEDNYSMCCLYGKTVRTLSMRFKQQKHSEKKWKIINFEDDVNCGIIDFCDKISFLTGNVLLLQGNIRWEITQIMMVMGQEQRGERYKNKREFEMMKVSSLTRTSNLHHFTLIHRGVDIMSDCCALFTLLYHFDTNNRKLLCTRWRSDWGTALQTGRSRVRFPVV